MRAVPIARRTLERRFKTMLGRSLAEEIRRTKIEKVRQHLTDTDMPVPEIAHACGFAYAEHMIPHFALRMLERAQMRADDRATPAGGEGLDAKDEAWKQIRRRGAPGVVPILVGFEFLVPRLPSDRSAALEHMPPAALARSGDERERGVAHAILQQSLEQVLRGVDRAGHASPHDECGHSRARAVGHEAERQGEEIRMLRRVIGAFAVAIDAARGIKEFFLKGGAGGALAGGVVGGVGLVA